VGRQDESEADPEAAKLGQPEAMAVISAGTSFQPAVAAQTLQRNKSEFRVWTSAIGVDGWCKLLE